MAAFDAVDFVIFGAFLCISITIGVYHAWKSRRIRLRSDSDEAHTAEFLMGSREMPVVPVALSLITTFLSGVTMLGTPAEIYQRGLLFMIYYVCAGLALMCTGIFFIPIIYRLKPISIYEYFQKRFDSLLLRRVAATIFLTNSVFYMAVVLYSPAVALSGATHMPTWPFILIVGICCTFYTTIGGLKAVVWTDTLQAFFIYLGVGIMIIKGTIDAGGISNVFNTAWDTGRVQAMNQLDLNPAQDWTPGLLKTALVVHLAVPGLLTAPEFFFEFNYAKDNQSDGVIWHYESPIWAWRKYFACGILCASCGFVSGLCYLVIFRKAREARRQVEQQVEGNLSSRKAEFNLAIVGFVLFVLTALCGVYCFVATAASDPALLAALIPFQHNSLWISIFGAFAFWMSQHGLNQMSMQRYCSLPSLRDAYKVVIISIPCYILLGLMASYIGLLMLAYFLNTSGDPFQTSDVAGDQLVILFAIEVLSYPGLPGLFLACLFSSTLSTISSGMNSMAAVTWEDFMKGHLGGKVTDDTAAAINKSLVLAYGMIAIGLAFLAEPIGGIIKASFVVMGAIAGPLIGLFFLGVFNPFASKVGAFVSVLLAVGFNIWIALGNIITKPYAKYRLPLPTPENYTTPEPLNFDPHYGDPDVFYLYKISGFLYPFIGILVVVIVGSIVSLVFPDSKSKASHKQHHALTFCGRNEQISKKEKKETIEIEIKPLTI